MIYPLDDYLHNSTFIVPSQSNRGNEKPKKKPPRLGGFIELTVVDNYSREYLEIEVGQHIRGEDVVGVVKRIKSTNGTLCFIKVDNGPEFISKELDNWAYGNRVTLDFSRPAKPIDNAYVGSFNGSFRDDCLNIHWFLSLDDAKEKIETWRREYNE